MSQDRLHQYNSEFQDVLEYLKMDLNSLRTGRATPALVENLPIEAYGARTNLVGLASISIPDARTIVVEPWDKSLLKDIEKGIQEAKIGLNPTVQGKIVRISLPALTEEGRKELIKVMNEKLEHARIGVRGVREKVRADVVQAEKDKDLTEDEKYRLLEQLDKTVAGWNEKIKNVGEDKEKEIMTI